MNDFDDDFNGDSLADDAVAEKVQAVLMALSNACMKAAQVLAKIGYDATDASLRGSHPTNGDAVRLAETAPGIMHLLKCINDIEDNRS